MRDPDLEGEWDFTPVIDLIQLFSNPVQDVILCNGASSPGASDTSHLNVDDKKGNYSTISSLGDFEDVWRYLGSPSHARYGADFVKTVRWQDEINGPDLAEADEDGDDDWLKGLTKQQRKKARRKARRLALAETSTNGKKVVVSSSENESDSQNPRTPNRKALIHELLDRPLPAGVEPNGRIQVLKRPISISKDDRPVTRSQTSLLKTQEESAYAVAAAKKTKLIGMLKQRFIDERIYLSDACINFHVDSSFPNTSEDQGLHIFIDASNIMIGFHDALRIARSLPLASRMKRQPMSFHSLSLILSRGRPTSKRVVVGSDNFSEMTEAKLIGYETNILDRVHKAKELTPRQKRYANRENGATSAGSGSETTAAVLQKAPEKWVEQAVDEILHLKMMESLVDAVEPATIVLATGDAAAAEFSGGFLRMVERALGKGWKVELACWKHNMSAAYKKKDFRQRWGGSFRVIELDDFVELLLGETWRD